MNTDNRLQGVYTARKKNGDIYYRASLTYRTKHISLGSFPTIEQAHQAYNEGLSALYMPGSSEVSSLKIMDYKKSYELAFDKWVCLINFRDNGMYFGTPIYMRPRFFYYYYAKEWVLKFDLDDLFYYATRTIMRRGNHYFVADFGMQVNIQNRYGIKNYAVSGRDFRFINGDTTDYRRENLEILNTFQGVLIQKIKGITKYRARIHIKGNYIIGTYDTMVEAAIAYNKAIDILKKAGVTTNYTPNYIENLSPSVYADIYSRIPISDNITKKFL